MKGRVVLADDHPAFNLGLRLALEDEGFEVAAVALDGSDALRAAREHRPDAVVLDVRMPGMTGIETCRAINEQGLATAVVMLSTYDDAATMRRAQEAGARAFLTKETPTHAIAQVIVRLLLEPRLTLIAAPPIPTFTERERQVLAALGEGSSNKEIARRLGIGVETVKDHVQRLFAKLGVGDRLNAVKRARELGVLER